MTVRARTQRRTLPCVGLAVAGTALVCGVVSVSRTGGTSAFATQQPVASRFRTQVFAESKDKAAAAPAPAPAPAPSASKASSTALVVVNDENAMTTASVLTGFAGALLGGVWLGGALFAAGAYYARKENDDASQALKGIATASLEALNFGASLNDKYTITDSLGSAINEALAKQESTSGVSSFLNSLGSSIKQLDDEISLKDTFGTLATAASDLASQAVDKALELNEEYKISEQISEKISQQTKSSK